jgi:hypothetical protein
MSTSEIDGAPTFPTDSVHAFCRTLWQAGLPSLRGCRRAAGTTRRASRTERGRGGHHARSSPFSPLRHSDPGDRRGRQRRARGADRRSCPAARPALRGRRLLVPAHPVEEIDKRGGVEGLGHDADVPVGVDGELRPCPGVRGAGDRRRASSPCLRPSMASIVGS